MYFIGHWKAQCDEKWEAVERWILLRIKESQGGHATIQIRVFAYMCVCLCTTYTLGAVELLRASELQGLELQMVLSPY